MTIFISYAILILILKSLAFGIALWQTLTLLSNFYGGYLHAMSTKELKMSSGALKPRYYVYVAFAWTVFYLLCGL
tara:strand:- start:724 stop:948 length:225 start_codon:yes stop_codon:yes gene_type:complete